LIHFIISHKSVPIKRKIYHTSAQKGYLNIHINNSQINSKHKPAQKMRFIRLFI